MRTALTIGLILGTEVWEFLHGPETDLPTQRAEFKRLRGQREHPKYAEVQLWESGAGIVVRHRFNRAALLDQAIAVATPSAEPPPGETPEAAPPAAESIEPADADAQADFAVPSGKPPPLLARHRRRR